MTTGGRSRVPGWVRAVPIVAAFTVGAASFTLSFFAQSEVASSLGAVPERLAWLVPVTIDGGILAGSASLWASSTRGSRKDPVAYLTIVALLALSVVINVRHASGAGEVLASVIAGAPPVVLLLCLELVAAQARRDARAADVVDVAADAPVQVAAPPVQDRPSPPRQPVWSPPVSASTQALVSAPVVSGDVVATEPAGVPVTGEGRTAPELPVVADPAPVRAPGSPSTAERVRVAFGEHVGNGGDPSDPGLARRLADELAAPLPSVRRILATERKAHEARAADAQGAGLHVVSAA